MKKSRKSQIFRIGDIVKIKNPEFFIRCGYPLTKEDIKREFLADKEKIEAFDKFIKKVGLNSDFESDPIIFPDPFRDDYFTEILDRVYYKILQQRNFGGSERKIITEQKLEFKDQEFRVVSKFIVNTGIRENGETYYSYDDTPEYYPPYLSNQKSHVILEVQSLKNDIFDFPENCLKIEEINVELLKDPIY